MVAYNPKPLQLFGAYITFNAACPALQFPQVYVFAVLFAQVATRLLQ